MSAWMLVLPLWQTMYLVASCGLLSTGSLLASVDIPSTSYVYRKQSNLHNAVLIIYIVPMIRDAP